jgi:hypothetical protein
MHIGIIVICFYIGARGARKIEMIYFVFILLYKNNKQQ